MTPQWATVLLSVLALAFSIYSGIRANGKTDRKDAEEAGKQESAVMMKLEVVQNTLLEVKQDIKSQKLEMEKMNERTIRNEESLKSLHKRVDRMEALLQLSPDAVTHETHYTKNRARKGAKASFRMPGRRKQHDQLESKNQE